MFPRLEVGLLVCRNCITMHSGNYECINNSHRFHNHMVLGDLAFEETGKFAGIGALSEGKVEATYQGTGKLFDADYSSVYTGVATPHGGTLIAEFNGICTTTEGDL